MPVRESAYTTRPGRVAFLVAAAALGLASGCTSAVSGHPRAVVAPGTVEATYLSTDDVSALVGTTLASASGVSEPPAALTVDPPACAAAVGPATEAVYARGWQRFGARSYQDSTGEHVVTQVLGVYPDGDRANAAFGTLNDSLSRCTTAVRINQDHSSVKWTYAVDNTATDSLAWTAAEDAGDGWACSRQARRKGAALLQVSVCQAGDGRQAARLIADRFASRVGP